MNIKIIPALLILCAVLLAAPPTANHKGLDLTPEQSKKIEANRKATTEKVRGHQQQIQQEYRKLNEEMQRSKPDTKKLQSIKKNILKLEEARLNEMIKNEKELNKILTTEQREQLRKRGEEAARNNKGMERKSPPPQQKERQERPERGKRPQQPMPRPEQGKK